MSISLGSGGPTSLNIKVGASSHEAPNLKVSALCEVRILRTGIGTELVCEIALKLAVFAILKVL